MSENKLPLPRAGETAEQYHQRLLEAGFVSAEVEPTLQSNGSEPKQTQAEVPHETRIAQFMAGVPETGTIGNITLRERLCALDPSWTTDLYGEVREHCIELGILKAGRGRGGSVSRVSQEPLAEPEMAILPESSSNSGAQSQTNQIRASQERAVVAFKAGNLAAAIVEWNALAEDNVASAQYNLAMLYLAGKGVAKDFELAWNWLSRAVISGHAKAQFSMGRMYETGNGVQADSEAARMYYQMAAESGLTEAQNALTALLQRSEDDEYDALLDELLEDSEETTTFSFTAEQFDNPAEGQEKDNDDPSKQMRHAAEHGNAKAQYDIGISYQFGFNGFSQDVKYALDWLLRSAAQGYAEAQYALGQAYGEPGEDGESLLPVTPSPEEQVRWFRMAANQAHVEAMFDLKEIYESGEYLPGDSEEAFKALLQFAEKGDCVAQYLVARSYKFADEWPLAAKWYEMAAEQGHPWAAWRFAHCCEWGLGIPQNIDDAAYWYLSAIKQEKCNEACGGRDGDALLYAVAYALRLANKLDEEKNHSKSFELYRVAADNSFSDIDKGDLLKFEDEVVSIDLPHAQLTTAEYLRLGLAGPVDNEEAVRWYRKAANKGNEAAMCALGIAYFDGAGVPANTIAGYALLLLAEEGGDEEAIEVLEKLSKSEGCPKGAEKLATQMKKPGNFLEALDKHMEKSLARRKTNKVHARSEMGND